MSTIHIPNSFLFDVFKGSIDLDTDTFKILLVTSTYAYNRDTHTKRSDITNEVTGTGYTAGGMAIVPTVTNDTTNDKLVVTLPQVIWTGSTTITARQAVVYKSRGGASSADELVAIVDFGSDVVSSGGTFTVNEVSLEFTGF